MELAKGGGCSDAFGFWFCMYTSRVRTSEPDIREISWSSVPETHDIHSRYTTE